MAEVAHIDDHFDPRILLGELPEDVDSLVLGGVVNEQVLVVVAGHGGHDLFDLPMHLSDIVLLVVTGSEDGQIRHVAIPCFAR